MDVIQLSSEPAPQEGVRIMCRHPFQEKKRAQIIPCTVKPLLHLVWNGKEGRVLDGAEKDVTGASRVEIIRSYICEQLSQIRPDHLRYLNPTPYKVSVDQKLYDFMHNLWMTEAPVQDLE